MSELRLGHVVIDGDDVYWVEGRPDEGGRAVVVRRRADGTTSDATPPGTDVRTRVQEYGGAAYTVSRGVIYFSDAADQRLYKLEPGGMPEAMTPPGPWRYADATIDGARRRLVCIREDHAQPAGTSREAAGGAAPDHVPTVRDVVPSGVAFEPTTTLVSIPLDGSPTPGAVVASGYDFYATPRVSPNGRHLAWLSWRHPQMPWDGTELWVAEVRPDGTLDALRFVAGGARESIVQPGWSPDSELYFVSDRTNWWNLYRTRDGAIEAVYPVDADCGRPAWSLGSATWAFAGPSRLVVARAVDGRWQLVSSTFIAGDPPRPDAWQPLTTFEPGDYLTASASQVVFVGGSPTAPDAVLRVDLTSNENGANGVPGGNGAFTTAALCVSAPAVDPAEVSVPRAIQFQTGRGLTAHAFYYAPSERAGSDATRAREGASTPLLVTSHGGPTGAASARFNPEIQFWTSHGFAVVDVNYGGSSGYGRAYRERLNGQWGIVDVDDCVNAALHLVSLRLAGRDRLAIRGKSAGGYTTLAALTFHAGVFAAGASYYGIGDLELLARDTHKFESRYLDGLVGPYPAERDLYRARSPINFVENLACPLILFQGLDDAVVPPEHAERMAAALSAKGLPVKLVLFPGEGHGFRKAETITRCRDAELAFYRTALAAGRPRS